MTDVVPRKSSYPILPPATRGLDGIQRYANGTVVLTIKDHRPRRRSPDQNG